MAKPTERTGKIALLALIFLLVIVVLMTLLGNAGHGVKQKMEVQHAADAAAFSGSLWMARGMNAITASNHLIGEATAIGAVQDAIGGSELRLGLAATTTEDEQLDAAIRSLSPVAPIAALGTYYPFLAALTSLDRSIVRAVVNRTSPQNAEQLKAFATLYDSRVTLKRELIIWLATKATANLVFLIPPPFDIPWSIAATAAHVVGTVKVALIGKEWLLLEVLEVYARAAAPIQETALASQLVPTLADFSAATAGLDLANPSQPAEGGLALDKVESTIGDVDDRHQVTAAIVPVDNERRMPVVFEPRANMDGRSGAWPTGWGSDEPAVLSEATGAVDSILNKLEQGTQELSGAILVRSRALKDLEEIRDQISEKLSDGELEDDHRQEFEAELKKVQELVLQTREEIRELVQSESRIADQRSVIDQALSASETGNSQNPSLANIPEPLDPNQEKRTQWLRATVPNVDAIRAPLLGLMQSQLPISHAAEHFEKWTNRYAMIHAWRHRTGMRLVKTSNSTATWRRQQEPLSMIVMADSYEAETSVKGLEGWTKRHTGGRNRAEDLFTLFSAAHRDYQPLFAGKVMDSGQSNGMTSFAQSILYNANPQEGLPASSAEQPVAGWDTLNWDTRSSPSIPEWGAKATVQATQWPWEVFDGLANAPQIKLNWQAKLVPVTARRLKTAADQLDGDVQPALELSVDHSDLISH